MAQINVSTIEYKVKQFFQTLTLDILKPSDYVYWDKINKKIKELRREIALLNSLDFDNPLKDLSDLLVTNPKILDILQLLIAHTPDKIYFEQANKYIDFKKDKLTISKNPKRAKTIANVFIEMGLIEFLKQVKNIEDVIRGILIGLEPNARKNRRGKKLETQIKILLEKTLKEIKETTNLNLVFKTQMYVKLKSEDKRLDYMILVNNKPKIAVEVNFYSVSGSKPSEVIARAYPELQESLQKNSIHLIVISDGRGWQKMKPVIYTAYNKLHFFMNIKQAKQGLLKQSILEILNI